MGLTGKDSDDKYLIREFQVSPGPSITAAPASNHPARHRAATGDASPLTSSQLKMKYGTNPPHYVAGAALQHG